jgi:hypothetical protein
VHLQKAKDRSLTPVKQRMWFKATNRSGVVYMLHLGSAETRHVWRFKW